MILINIKTGNYYNEGNIPPDNEKMELVGVNLNPSRVNTLKISFRDKSGCIFVYDTYDILEISIIQEIIAGFKLWDYNTVVKINNYHNHNYPLYNVNVFIYLDEIHIKDYLNTSLALKLYFSREFQKVYNTNIINLKDISYLPYTSPIDNPNFSKIKLFDYQRETVKKMLLIEKNEYDLSINFNMIKTFGDVDVIFNPHLGNFVNSNTTENNSKISIKGGILADEMGLGKTITSLSLVAMNPSNIDLNYKDDLIYSKATLIVCPSHLCKQWATEVKKIFPKAKIIQLLTKVNHSKLKYRDLKEADIIIVSQQFLMNFKYYPQVNYKACTPATFDHQARNYVLKQLLTNWKTDKTFEEILNKEAPNVEHFYFHRLIIDESHEIFGFQLSNQSLAKYMNDWLKSVNSSFKWFVSGTPFINNSGIEKCLEFLNLRLTNVDIDFEKLLLKKKYIINQIFEKIIIRHRKIDIENQIQIPGYEEEVLWINLTDLEGKLYTSKKDYASRSNLQQLCCHILVSDSTSKYFSNAEMDLDEMQDKLIEYHKKTIKDYTYKLTTLDITNQAYHMLKKTYETKVSESKYMLTILEKITSKEEDTVEENCSICFDELDNPTLTSCGHIFCKECLDACLNIKKNCPLCKADLKGKDVYLLDSNNKKVEEETNPLIKKYGSKLGKLVSLVRKLTLNDDNRIIIFSQWDKMLNLIGRTLKENGVSNSFIKGNVWSRNSAINKFKEGKDSSGEDNKVIMLSLSNSASGTNLIEATHILFVEPIDSSHEKIKAIEGQAIGRACRLGQKNKIKVMRILTKGTIEEEIYQKYYSQNIDKIDRTVYENCTIEV